FVMDVPGHAEPFIITDAAVNIFPTFSDKVDIMQNAIDLAHVLGFPQVRVAILSAVEMINPKIPSTMEGAALCKMADRGQIERCSEHHRRRNIRQHDKLKAGGDRIEQRWSGI